MLTRESDVRTAVRGRTLESAASPFAWLPALAAAVFTAAIVVVAVYWPPAQGQMAVVFLPGTSEQQAFRAVLDAGGRFVSGSRFDNVVIAYAPDAEFAARVRAQGGLFTLAAEGLCSPSINR